MSRFSVGVIFVGAWLFGLAILMPPWSRTLSTPYGGVREFTWGAPIFTRPEPSGSKRWVGGGGPGDLRDPGRRRRLPDPAVFRQDTPGIDESQTSDKSSRAGPETPGTPRTRGARGVALRPRDQAGQRLGLGLPGNSPGFRRHRLAGANPATYYVACLLGVAANILLVVGYAATLTRRYGAGFAFSAAATALTIGVLVPLAASHKLNGLMIGHALWVASAGLLTFASGRLRLGSSSSDPSPG